MRYTTFILALAALCIATPVPQNLDFEAIVTSEGAAPTATIPLGDGASSEIVSYSATAVASDTYESVIAEHPARMAKREWDCSEQALGSGPVPTTDTPDAFLALGNFSDAANAASTPDGYTQVFQNQKGSSQVSAYMGYASLDSYDPQTCADQCSQKAGCVSFNIFFERDPSIVPASSCPNPASTSVIRCVFWGTVITLETVTNTGQWRNDFQVVIAGSNGYVRSPSQADSITDYTGAYLGSNAILAPNDCNGRDTYITYKDFSDGAPFDATRCAAACEAETQFNIDHLNSRSICRFFNTYILLKNGIPQGQVCAIYNETWSGQYAKNDGQWRDNDHYTIAYSHTYSNTADPGLPICPSDITYLSTPENEAFCSSYISYEPSTVTTSIVSTISTIAVAQSTSMTITTPTPSTTSVLTTVFSTTTSTLVIPTTRIVRTYIYLDKRDEHSVAPRQNSVPLAFANWPASKISSACSAVATGVTTSTVFASTQTVYTVTSISIAVLSSTAPAPTVTITIGVSQIATSFVTTTSAVTTRTQTVYILT